MVDVGPMMISMQREIESLRQEIHKLTARPATTPNPDVATIGVLTEDLVVGGSAQFRRRLVTQVGATISISDAIDTETVFDDSYLENTLPAGTKIFTVRVGSSHILNGYKCP